MTTRNEKLPLMVGAISPEPLLFSVCLLVKFLFQVHVASKAADNYRLYTFTEVLARALF